MGIKPLSYRQSQAIRFWVAGGRKSKADALRKAGYANSVIHQPQKVFGSLAVKRELERLGHGSLGILNGQKPKEVIRPVKAGAKNIFDISSLSEETIQNLRDKMESTPPRNPIVTIEESIYGKNSTTPANDPSCNIFGERLSDTHFQEKGIKMRDYSIM